MVPLGQGKPVVVPLGDGYALVYLPGFNSRVPCSSSEAVTSVAVGTEGAVFLKVCFGSGASLNNVTIEAIRGPETTEKLVHGPTVVGIPMPNGQMKHEMMDIPYDVREHIINYECVPALVYEPTFADCRNVRIVGGVPDYGALPGR